MGAVAAMLHDQGYKVTGSDEHVYPPMSTFLEEKGIAIQAGYKPENLPDGGRHPRRRQHDQARQPGAGGRAGSQALIISRCRRR